MECQKEQNLKACPCTYPECSRKGICCDCIRHHLVKNELPACYFSAEAERTYDRSFEKFNSRTYINTLANQGSAEAGSY